MRKKICYTFLLVSIAQSLSGQDFHLSQYDVATQYLNPALTGMYRNEKTDYRFYADYRSQWISPSLKPYSTAYLSFDMPVLTRTQDFGFGGYLINNRSGLGHINSFNFILSGAYNITGGLKSRHILSTGLQMGLLHRSFDPNSYTYDVQYSESMDGFDTSIPNQENFSRSSLTGFDANFGIFYKYIARDAQFHPFGGLAVYHVTQPNESFSGGKIKTPMRFNLHGGCDIEVNAKLMLTPKILYMNQARANELNIGFLSYYKIKNSPYEAIFQCDYRNKDAIVLGVGLKQYQHIFRLSYDINTSSLGPYLGGKGSWEFTLILSGRKDRPLFGK